MLLCVAVWYATLAPSVVGGPLSLVIVRGTSMQPTYQGGDLVVGYRTNAPLEVGEVVVFRGPGETPVIHRVRAVEGERLVTRGDNRTADDPWDTRFGDVLGTARWHLPGVGRVMVRLGEPAVLGLLAGLFTVLLTLLVRRQSAHRHDRDPRASEVAAPSLSSDAAAPSHRWLVFGFALLFAIGTVSVARAASMTVAADQLAPFSVPGPYVTYVVTPGGGGGGNGGGGGGRGGGRP